MRSSSPVFLATLALLCAACLAPTAAAAPTNLAFEAPQSTTANSTVPVGVTLRIGSFLCHEPHPVTVSLTTTNSDGVRAVFQQSTITFTLPARSFFAEDFVETQTVNLTVRAIAVGSIDLGATLTADVGPCFVPGGFDPASATATLYVEGPATLDAPPAPPANETAPEANATNETTTETPTPATPKPKPSNKGPVCGPDGGCGAIGDYAAPQESGSNSVPSASLLALMGVIGIAALVARRRRPRNK